MRVCVYERWHSFRVLITLVMKLLVEKVHRLSYMMQGNNIHIYMINQGHPSQTSHGRKWADPDVDSDSDAEGPDRPKG